ncbi:OLC1v1038125C1 [Oldenlandia corymbosa var. corymbosa]|uniref:Flavin-containing monooxygenase n=1 Tax=Oldenlandia corymbosa var. corymbosa TaxID=529605 RepID=A0AAV1D266_OLDCO|nr:OLC1v1038125C1 [Oldenlandia corymbosa var. corymbosa]
MENRRIIIVGAGFSGLLACKYAVEKGFHPVVFEAQDSVGGIWNHTIESTRLQNVKEGFQFSDFPWPPSVQDVLPRNTQVLQYVQSYAQHLGLMRYIKFNSTVIGIDYNGVSIEEMQTWDLWSGTGKPFGSKGKWTIKVQHIDQGSLIKEYEAEFVILCIGRFSGLPNIPEFAQDHGPEIFGGKVLHAMEYSAMDNASAAEFIKGKRIAIVGSMKSAVDLAAECADANELLLHKPGEGFLHSALAFLLSPLRWGIEKLVESDLRWKLPLKKHRMIPKHGFLQAISTCGIFSLPENFYDKVEKGSIVLKNSEVIGFCKEGLMIDGEAQPVKADIVLLATGYKGDEKLRNMFTSSVFQNYMTGKPNSVISLYRQIVHPRIPQLAIIGYAQSHNNLYTLEMKCRWLANILDETFQLPSIKEMEKDVVEWEVYLKRYGGKYYRSSCVAGVHTWYNDQLCRDIGWNPRRKKGFILDLIQAYGPSDYKEPI